MYNLKEIAEKKTNTEIPIAPQKFAIPPQELVPHRTDMVETQLPIASYITSRFEQKAIRDYIRKGIPLDDARQNLLTATIAQSRLLETNFLAFDMVRRSANTGFEGYGAGTFTSAQDMAEAIAKLGVTVLQGIRNQHTKAGDHLFMQRMWKTLSGEQVDPQMVQYLYSQLGALIGVLKQETQDNRPVDVVRQTARSFAEKVPQIVYTAEENKPLSQRYVLPKLEQVQGVLQKTIPVDSISPLMFQGRPEMWGYIFMLRLGMFGHSLMRAGINQNILIGK